MSEAIQVHPEYNYKVVRQFAVMTVVWGIIGMAVGVLIAAQLYWPALNFDTPWLTFSRLRPLHTNAVIFAFGGCALFATSLYVVQRTSNVRLFSDKLASFTFWGWQAVKTSKCRLHKRWRMCWMEDRNWDRCCAHLCRAP